MPTKTGPKTLTKATTEVTTRLACIQSRGPCAKEAKRNPKKATVLMKWKGLPAKESVIVSDHERPAYLGPKRMHMGQKKRMPKSTPEQMDSNDEPEIAQDEVAESRGGHGRE